MSTRAWPPRSFGSPTRRRWTEKRRLLPPGSPFFAGGRKPRAVCTRSASLSGRKRAISVAVMTSRRAACAVVAFDGDAEAELGQRRAKDAFGAGLHIGPRAEELHDLGAEAPGARDKPRLLRASCPQPRGGRARAGDSPWPLPNLAKARARFWSGIAQVGTEQPSTARWSGGNVVAVKFSSTA